jgi:protein-S-isoprenylcysteine O-methyltransferase Ste14
MKNHQITLHNIRKFEFESRIFISLFIVLIFCLLSFFLFKTEPANPVIIGNLFGTDPEIAIKLNFLIVTLMLSTATLLRMWAGSILSSHRVMSFKVKSNKFMTSGHYRLVRNPIYLADFIAYTAFALCLKPIALPLPLIMWVHYTQLVVYEESALYQNFGEDYRRFKREVPRFFPNAKSLKKFFPTIGTFKINYDGFRNNALYLLFVVGFITAAFTEI